MNPRDDQSVFDDEGAGYLISVSDMMSGLLFIFIITLMAFVLNFQQEADRYREINERFTDAERVRAEMLQQIQSALMQQGIQVEIDEQHGVLRLTENAILFDKGRATLRASEVEKLGKIGRVLSEVLPCYSSGPSNLRIPDCDPRYIGRLESVFIEGHTDSTPIRTSKFADNWELSAARAIYTYHQLVDDNQKLSGLINQKGQPIFSVSGYGEGRPVPGYHESQDPRVNRRIDLRFIMTAPPEDEGIKQFKRELQEAGTK